MSEERTGRALFHHNALQDTELEVKAGDHLVILERNLNGWCRAYNPHTTRHGLVPAAYIQLDPSPLSIPLLPVTPVKQLPEPLSSNTRFAFYAANICRLNAIASIAVGIASFIVAVEATVLHPGIYDISFGKLQISVFFYMMLSGIAIAVVESQSNAKLLEKVPSRAIVYVFVSVPFFLSTFSVFNGVIYIIAAAIHLLSGIKREHILPPKYNPSKTTKQTSSSPRQPVCCVCSYVQDRIKSGKVGKYVFIGMYGLMNLALFVYGLYKYYPLVEPDGELADFTVMVPWAKGFGFTLNFTCAIIVLPVCRTFIRFLYDYSTQDLSPSSRFLRAVLWLFPLDKSLRFHEKQDG